MSARTRPYAAFFFDMPAQDRREWLAAQCAAIGIVDPEDGDVLAGAWGGTWVYAQAHDLTECRVLSLEFASYGAFYEMVDQTRGDALEEDGLYPVAVAFRDACDTLRPRFGFFMYIPMAEILDEVADAEERVLCYEVDKLVNDLYGLVYLSREYDEALFPGELRGRRDELPSATGRVIFASHGRDRWRPERPRPKQDPPPAQDPPAVPAAPDSQAPPVTPELRARARENPGQRIPMVDPLYRGRGEVPPHGIAGFWEVDDQGELARYEHNPDYRPSPRARGWPDPTDPVDDAVQLLASGHASEEALIDALARATVTVAVTGNDAIRVIENEQDPEVAVFTAPRHLPEGDHRWRQYPVRDLIGVLPPGCALAINLNSPASPVNVRVPMAEVAAFLQASQNQW
ncbi:hypothetical protein C3Y87_09070 [Carbonactinospora thermoautotrophica]|uniref:type VII secretion system-associated protein n=1 Tax=Carbonactinospora thermoautotrophica TaxID=1469144 RepID=UPI00226F4871|nr:type VII secretion system-associated protein [Carbonactinospora thermoautotrophica]MCX9191562.1 hypothetical protein [Carbonactinospora thermoautotrophica]